MDETNPTDTTANRGNGPNPAPAVSGAAPNAAAAIPAAAASVQSVPPVPPVPVTPEPTVSAGRAQQVPIPPTQPVQVQTAIPIPPVPPVQSVPVQPPMQIPVPTVPPVQPMPLPPVQPQPLSQTPATSAGEVGAVPVSSEQPTPQTPSAPGPKPLRSDIASILGKIKLPERITLRMSGESAKPTVPPPVVTPPAPEKQAGGAEAPLPQPSGVPAQAPRQNVAEQKEKGPASSVTSVHTLKDDLQGVVRDKKMSLVRAVALESEQRKGQEHLVGPHLPADKTRSRKVIGIALVTVILLALALAAFVGVKSVLEQGAGSAQPTATPSLIFAENTYAFPEGKRTGDGLKRALVALAHSVPNTPLGTIVRIVPTLTQTNANGTAAEQSQSIGDFLTALGTQATPELIRSFRGDFFLGLHQIVEKRSPVIIIPITSYERAFAGMLAWELTMNGDLSPMFTSIPRQTVNEKGLFVEREFQDSLINNYDVRVLKDDSGATQLMYSFPTRTMLIISESPYSFTEALNRLRASRQL